MGYRPQRWHDEIILFLGTELGIACELAPFPWPPHVPTLTEIHTILHEGIQDRLVEQDAELVAAHVLETPLRYVTWDATTFLTQLENFSC